jgi:uncharacterized membrane protein
MLILDLITIVSIGLLIGNELAVSLFVNPALWKLDASLQAPAFKQLVRLLGKFMPFWYMFCFLLLIMEAYARRHDASVHLLHVAIAIWLLTVIYTLALLVPINNRIAQMDPASPFPGWQSQHVKWDKLHRLRVALLLIAMVCVLLELVPTP